MASNYFIEYTHFVNDLQNKLMRIQLKFNECIDNVKTAVSKGVLTPEEGDYLLAQRMDKYYGSVDSKYRLSQSDVEFVRQYASVDSNGLLLANSLKGDYLDKKDKLSAILESVKIYGYLNSLSDGDARLSVKVVMNDYYNNQLSNLESKMNNILLKYGEKGKQTRKYVELEEQRNKLLKALNFIVNLDKVPEEVFDRVVSQFYGVDRKYYDWFLKMKIKHEYDDGTMFNKHCDTMRELDKTGNAILNTNNQVIELNKELEITNKDLFNALIGIATLDINSYLSGQEKTKKKLFGRGEKNNNKEVLLNIFIGLMSIGGIISYIKDVFGNGSSSISLNSVFATYFNKKYGEDTVYVDPNTFVNDLRNDIVTYYKDKIANIISKISVLNVKINSNTTSLCGNIKLGMNEAILQRDVGERYPTKRSELIITGFTFEELERIYTDLKEFIGNGFSFGTDDEELFLRKA